MKTSQRLAAGIISAALLAVPVLVSAQATTAPENDSQIQALLMQIKTLQQQVMDLMKQKMGSSTGGFMDGMHDMMGTSTPSMGNCPEFMRDLKKGDTGDDVVALQQKLSEDTEVFPEGTVTGFFGPATARAVAKFQEKFGVGTSTGFFGPKTREHMRGQCGKGPRMMGTSTSGWMHHEDDHMAGSSTMMVMPAMPPRPEEGDMHGPRMMMPIVGATTTPRDGRDGRPQNF